MPMSADILKQKIDDLVLMGDNIDVLQNDCEIIEFMLDHCEIVIPEENRFFVKVTCEKLGYLSQRKRAGQFKNLTVDSGLSDGIEALAFPGTYDFGHTSAKWQSVISIGIYGLRERIAEYERTNVNAKKDFYKNLLRVYDAALRWIKRAADIAFSCEKLEMGEGLLKLCKERPSNLFEALQTCLIYYTLQQFFDGTALRTLGRLDSLLYPYYKKHDKIEAKALLLDYVKEIDRLKAAANIPFAICGTDADSNDMTNELSYALLDIYNKADIFNTKLHVLCSKKTPQILLEKAFSCIRDGKNSIVFISDEKVIESLKRQGAEHSDAVNYHVVGCYECGADGELTCSCNARVNIPKALELALNEGKDMLTGKLIGLDNRSNFETYDELQLEFERQLTYLCVCAMKATDICEAHYSEIHSSPFLSGTYVSALKKGGDLYCNYSAKYNNSSVNALGLATAVDSLAAIRKAVYEDKLLTLNEFVEILKTNWSEKEYLRLLIKNKYPKYGQGDPKTDALAKRTVDVLSKAISGRPNSKSGIYRLGLFSIDWRWSFGEKTAASADGRHRGEPLSQNTSANFGADREGATAHLVSAARIDMSKTPNGAIVDLDLHSSAVRGDNGIKALVTSLRTYFNLGGFAVHYNILDTNVLKAAKEHPEKYPTLQVRLCGWNVLFSSLSAKEQDEFIVRATE